VNKRNLYFVGPVVDGACMGGISLAVFVYFALFARGYGAIQVSGAALSAAAFLNWMVNFPHFAATNYRLYQSRENLRQFRLTAFLVPLVLTLAVVACFVWPELFAPTWTKMLILWSAYHYSGQHLGLTMLYARRAEVAVTPRWRFAIAGFLYSCFLAQYAELEASGHEMLVFSLPFPLLGIPAWIAPLCRGVAYCFAAFALGEGVSWMRKSGRKIPWIVALPALTHYVWTLLGAQTFSFQVLVPFFHGLQYLLVAWAVEMHAQGGGQPRVPSFLWMRSARWAFFVVAGGGLLFYALPRLVAGFGFDLAFCTAIFFVTVQVHHFFVDGVIWKLRTEAKRSPLFSHFSAGFGAPGEEHR
jgi:hypothetical protein